MAEAHSKYSASNHEANTLCPGRRVMQRHIPDSSSKYAYEGTAAHALLADLVDGKAPAKAYTVGKTAWPVTDDMNKAVRTALENIHEIVGDGMLLSEQRVCYAGYLGVPRDEGWGTSDIIAARGNELQVHDYKHGMGVEVDAEDNVQMRLYALGALEAVNDSLGPFETVRMVIHQPRIKSAPSEWTCTVAELEEWARTEGRRSVEEQQGAEHMHTSLAMKRVEWERVYLRPNEKSCKFCRAKVTCPALRDTVTQSVFEVSVASPDEFDGLAVAEKPKASDEAWLAGVLSKADLIEDYLKAVRAEVERRLLAGTPVPGFKVVIGKRGDRAWGDIKEAEALLVSAAGEKAYAPRKVISPTQAEELAPKKPKTRGPDKGKAPPPSLIGAEQWTALQVLITQADGRPHVAPVSDPRPALALTPVVDDFTPVSAEPVSDFA